MGAASVPAPGTGTNVGPTAGYSSSHYTPGGRANPVDAAISVWRPYIGRAGSALAGPDVQGDRRGGGRVERLDARLDRDPPALALP